MYCSIRISCFFELLRFGLISVASIDTKPQALKYKSNDWRVSYFIAEKHGSVPGRELHDWFEAELQINERNIKTGL